jgi:hypothetical protein
MIKNHILLFQLPGNWPTTKKCAPYFRGNTEFPIYLEKLIMRSPCHSAWISTFFLTGGNFRRCLVIKNYRRISILSAIAQLFELLNYRNRFEELQVLISSNTHISFWNQRGRIWKMVCRWIQSTPVVQSIRHQLILIKLALAVSPAECGLRSYRLSKEIQVNSGVPQGSHIMIAEPLSWPYRHIQYFRP